MDLYSAFIVVPHTQGAQVRITQFYLQITPYLPLPRKHSTDGASPDWGFGHLIAAYPTTHLSTPKEWKAESAWLADLQRTVCQHKWSPFSCRSSAGQRKFAGQRPTFYHCATVSCSVIEWLQAQNIAFQPILPTLIDFCYLLDSFYGSLDWSGLIMLIGLCCSLFFSSIPCCRLSWQPVSF